MRDQKSSALKHWLVDSIKSPWRFILIVGALSFAGLLDIASVRFIVSTRAKAAVKSDQTRLQV